MEMIRLRSLQIATVIYIVALANSGDPLLLAQDASAASHQSIGGTVMSVTPERISVKDHASSVVVLLAKGAQVSKQTIRHDFSDVHVGDKVLMRGQRNPSGDFVANEVWVNFTSFYGRILSVNDDSYEVQAFTEGGEVNGKPRKVVIDSDTLGEGNELLPRSELVPGQYVQTIGIKMSDGTVLATRAVIYGASSPPAGAIIITPNGNKVIKK